MVAASGGEGAPSPRVAWSLLAGTVVKMVGLLMFAPYSTDMGLAPMRHGAGVLRERGRQVFARFGSDQG
jgi:hypothetical protein